VDEVTDLTPGQMKKKPGAPLLTRPGYL